MFPKRSIKPIIFKQREHMHNLELTKYGLYYAAPIENEKVLLKFKINPINGALTPTN
ncbi:MAG: hypothetical protein ISQ88_04120 [Rhodobacteraceae bacterium]|nr:hypothetical protein [Paracoccaceae bacterium]